MRIKRIKLSPYGRKLFAWVGLIAAASALVTGAVLCVGDGAWRLHIGQMFYNIMFIAFVMPVCSWAIINCIEVIFHDEDDRS